MSDELVLATLGRLREEGLRIIASGDFLALLPDVQLWSDGALYLVRPLTRRSWTVRQAVRDAEQIVRGVQAQRMNTDMAVTA